MENCINYIKGIKKSENEIISVFYISQDYFTSDSLHKYKELVKISALSLINFKSHQKLYVKINKSLGFNLFLINNKFNIFELVNP